MAQDESEEQVYRERGGQVSGCWVFPYFKHKVRNKRETERERLHPTLSSVDEDSLFCEVVQQSEKKCEEKWQNVQILLESTFIQRKQLNHELLWLHNEHKIHNDTIIQTD